MEVDLGSTPARSGKFLLSGQSGLSTGRNVRFDQALGPYTGKGTLADEYEMDAVVASGTATSATEIAAVWTSAGLVRGNVKFLYDVASAQAPLVPTFASRFVRNNRPATASAWLAKAAVVKAGSARARVLCVGDSVTFGWGAGSGDAYTSARPLSYPAGLAAKFSAAGVPALNESFFAGFGGGVNSVAIMTAYDTRLAAGAGWVNATTLPTAGGNHWFNSSTANALSFTPSVPVDTFVIYYYTESAFGDFTLEIDGANQTAHSQNVAKSFASVTRTTTLGTHTLSIKRTSGYVRFAGVIAYNSATPAIDVINLGWSGSTAVTWNDAVEPWSPLNALGVLAPDLTIIKLGINDWQTATTLANYKAGINALIARAKLTGDVVLLAPNQTGGSAGTLAQDTYIDALRDLYETNNLRLADFYNFHGSYSALNSAGKMFDVLHPKAVVYDAEATVLGQLLTSNAATPPTTSFDPATLFAGAAGAFYDPSDLASMWQDSAGTLPAVVGQPVGRINDKSGNGVHATQINAASRPLLLQDPAGNRYLQADGIDDWMRSLFAMTGNWTRISLIRQSSWVFNAQIYGGGSTITGILQQQAAVQPNLRLYDGVSVTDAVTQATLGYDSIIVERHSGPTSSFKADNNAYVATNPGTVLPDGVTLFANNLTTPTAWAKVRLYGFVMINRTLSDPEIAPVVAHFSAKGDVVF